MMSQEDNGKVVTQQPNRKASRGGLAGSYNFCHGHPPEHPQKMGEDIR